MSLIQPRRIEEYLLRALKAGPRTCLALVRDVQISRPDTTKQAVYAALRSLKQEEQIIIVKGTASLNIVWINRMTGFLDTARQSYQSGSTREDFLELGDGDRIAYSFRDAHKADVFWTHAFYLLLDKLAPGEPVFLYNPHEWFLLARSDNEQAVITATIESGHPFLVTASARTFLDKRVTGCFDGTMSQYHMLDKPLYPNDRYYLNLFGDFLIEAWIDTDVVEKVDRLYRTTRGWDDEVKQSFRDVLTLNGRTRITISRNRKKALSLRRTLQKNFYLSKHRS